jgi:stearoyl-CoA desaturase (delta-9 desaturase)
MGEAWHNNHHAYPGSARIGIHPGQSDWGYAFICLLRRAGLAWDIVLPEHLDRAEAIKRVASPPSKAEEGLTKART